MSPKDDRISPKDDRIGLNGDLEINGLVLHNAEFEFIGEPLVLKRSSDRYPPAIALRWIVVYTTLAWLAIYWVARWIS